MDEVKLFELIEDKSSGDITLMDISGLGIRLREEDAKKLARQLNAIFAMRDDWQEQAKGYINGTLIV